jgi:nucleoside-diphosphate-sugar epimerase
VIDDVAAALLAAIDTAPDGVTRFDVGTGKAITIRELAEYMRPLRRSGTTTAELFDRDHLFRAIATRLWRGVTGAR